MTWFQTQAAENDARMASLLRSRPESLAHAAPGTIPSQVGLLPSRALIAVVDDEPAIAITLADILIRRGFEAVWFTAPLDALEFIKACAIDLLLTDITMPEMDGISLAAETLTLRPASAVFLLSARSHDSEVRRRVRSLGAAVHLEAKPLGVGLLMETIQQLLAQI